MLMERIMIQYDPSCHRTAPPHTSALYWCSYHLFCWRTQKSEPIITRRVNRTPSISLWCDCRELLLFAGVQLTRPLARAFRPPIYISGRCWPPAPTGTVLNSTLSCTWISKKSIDKWNVSCQNAMYPLGKKRVPLKMVYVFLGKGWFWDSWWLKGY